MLCVLCFLRATWYDRPLLEGGAGERGVWTTNSALFVVEKNVYRRLVFFPVPWATCCCGLACEGLYRDVSSKYYYIIEAHSHFGLNVQHIVMLPIAKRWGENAWFMDNANFRQCSEAPPKAGSGGGLLICDTGLLTTSTAEATWLAYCRRTSGAQSVRRVVDDSQCYGGAATLEPSPTLPQSGLDHEIPNVKVRNGLVKQTAKATKLLSSVLLHQACDMTRNTQVGGALCLLSMLLFLPIGFDTFHTQQLENEARQLDRASVAAFAQQATIRATLAMLGARLNATPDNENKQYVHVINIFKLLRAAISSEEQLYLSHLEYSDGKWQLEVLAKAFEDVDALQCHWRSLGLRGKVSVVRNKNNGLQVSAILEQVAQP